MIKNQKPEEKILKIAVEIAKEGKGALFIIGNIAHKRLLKQQFRPFSIFESGSEKLVKSLAELDGAVIIDKKGVVKDYGAMITITKTIKGYGTRHAAALTASNNGNTSILCSEEKRKVKIFKNNKYIMQIDALQKDVMKGLPKAISLLESIGAGALGTIGTTIVAPQFAITLPAGILIFGASYYALREIIRRWRF